MINDFRWQVTFAITLVTFGIVSLLSAADRLPGPADQLIKAKGAETSADPQPDESSELPPAAAAQYIGTNKCFQCHRPQTNTWSETKHAHAFTDMPQQYQSDPSCLKCHTTGFGEPSGYVAGTDKDLSMVGCEVCHGPGAAHIDAANRFVLAMPDEEAKIEQEMRDTIMKAPTDSVCIECHFEQAHHSHPPYERPASSQSARASSLASRPVAHRPTVITAATCTFSGFNVKTCGGCHYDHYKQWRAEKHAALSLMLPPQYLESPDCQGCHPSADAVATNLVTNDNKSHGQIGVVCELCHGPGLEHVRFNRQLINTWPLESSLDQVARRSISKARPTTACIECHLGESHKPHPEFAEK